MKSVKYLTTLIISMLFLSGCGSKNPGTAENKYVGSLPGIVKEYNDKETELKEKAKGASKIEDLLQLKKDLKTAGEESEKQIKEESARLHFPVQVPFEGETKNKLFEMKEIKVTDCTLNELHLTAKVIPNVSDEFLSAYFVMADKNGKPLQTKTERGVFSIFNFHNVKKGEPIELRASYRNVDKLVDFGKIIIYSKAG